MGLGRMPPAVNLVISNVPGPPFPLYLAGARLEAMYPMGPLMLGMGLNITVISYRESLDFGFMCCPEIVPAARVHRRRRAARARGAGGGDALSVVRGLRVLGLGF